MGSVQISQDIQRFGFEALIDLPEGQVTQVSSVIDVSQLEVAYTWGAQKLVFRSSVKYHGTDALIEMYRDPQAEDAPVSSRNDDVGIITIFPAVPLIEEPPLGTQELSESKALSHLIAKRYLKDLVPETAFFIAQDEKGMLRNWEIQTRVYGDTMKEIGSLLPHMGNLERIEALKLIGLVERMFQETGYMPDLHGDILNTANVVVSAEDKKSYLVDTDGQIVVDRDVVDSIKKNRESLIIDGRLHPLVAEWMKKTDSVEAERCFGLLQRTIDTLAIAKDYLRR